MKKLEHFAKLLPLATVFLILCSSAQLIIYYNYFNINIVNYLNSEEYLTLFIDDILYYLSIFGFGLFIFLIDNREKADNYIKHNKISNGIFLTIIGLCLVGIYFILKSEMLDSQKSTTVGVLVFFLLLLGYLYLSLTSLNFSYPLFIALAILVYSISDGIADAHKVFEKKDLKRYEFVSKEKSFWTDCNFLYLGSSKEYIFFYSPDNKESVILKNDDIQMILVKE